jgi:hypothetical protein
MKPYFESSEFKKKLPVKRNERRHINNNKQTNILLPIIGTWQNN